MNRFTVILIVMSTLTLICGCSVTIGSGGGHPHPRPYDDVTLSEIDAVSGLSFESGKLSA